MIVSFSVLCRLSYVDSLASLAIQQAFSKPCLVNLILKECGPGILQILGTVQSVNHATMYKNRKLK